MCKHLARHGKQSYPSIIATLRLGSFSFIQRDYDALVPFLRNHFLFVMLVWRKGNINNKSSATAEDGRPYDVYIGVA